MPPRPNLARAASTIATPLTGKARSQAPGRVYTDRKAFLFDYYAHLFTKSEQVLLFRHANMTVKEGGAIRRAIAKIPVPASAPMGATMTIARTGVLQPAVSTTRASAILEHLDGQTALVTCPSLSPKYIKAILAAIEKTMRSSRKDDEKDETKQPAFALVAGVIEGNVLLPAAVKEIAKVPEIEQLHSQLVGLLEMPQRQLVGVLTQAGGGGLVRTLQGLEESLKGDKPDAPSS